MPRDPKLLRELNLRCIDAIKELERFGDGIVPIAYIEEWLKSNAELKSKSSLKGPPGPITFFESQEDYDVTYAVINRFYHLFNKLNEFIEYRVFEPIAKEALKELKYLAQGEDALKEWLEKYKQLGSYDLILFNLHHLGEFETSSYYLRVYGLDRDIERTPFENIIEFSKQFNERYFTGEPTQ